jgi:asparagine synthase (glutamine-hydrolysing)
VSPTADENNVERGLQRALAVLRHRGPDAYGEARDSQVMLGHVRLAILDLSEAGRQPMRTPDGRFVISYNGEVYNFRELAARYGLTDLRSASDTEVVLRLFAKYGLKSLTELNGMFAFAVHDSAARKLWLVRDRLGIKPLYFRLDGARLTFGSEIKAVLAFDEDRPECEISALHEWLYYGNPLGGRTLYRGIHQLAPGHYLEIDLRTFKHRIGAYWTLESHVRERPAREPHFAGAAAEVRHLLEQAVRRQLVSDVPVGLFLSGGVDSSALAAFASRHYGGRLATYSAGFDFSRGEGELPKARRVARQFGTDHHELHVSGAHIGDLVRDLVRHHDMPFSDAANIPLALMAAEIRGITKVVLQGDGGDELFGGYSRYFTMGRYPLLRPIARLARHVDWLAPPSPLQQRASRYVRALSSEDQATAMALLLTPEDRSAEPPAIFARPFRDEVERADPFARHRECLPMFAGQDRVNQMSLLDLMITLPDTFLEKVDRATMAASLEVRVPFLDHDLVEFAVSLPGAVKAPGGRKKWLLKAALEGVVPAEVLHGPKIGLDVPYGTWLQGALKPMFFDELAEFTRRHPGVLDPQYIGELYVRTASRRRDDSYMLWKVLNFMIWANGANVDFEVRKGA